jgi:glucose/arabinose dehydrogenase
MIVRYPMTAGDLQPAGPPETIVSGFIRQRDHASKPFEFDDEGWMYVNVGAPSNACQNPARQPGVAGQDPCPQLDKQGDVWRFRADVPGQTQDADGFRFATGIRNGIANAWNPLTGKLYVAQHGRDDLHRFWPERYTEAQNAELPAEELFVIAEGDDFGWPYCYYDHLQEKKMLNPEYGGDGQTVGPCAQVDTPIMAFPGHWAPNDLMFYTGGHFPERYHGGAFLAFHGSWNRTPVQQGFRVVFIPFDGEQVIGDHENFAVGFTGAETVASPGDARFRPTGLALGPDGSLYIADSIQGRIWRVVYKG